MAFPMKSCGPCCTDYAAAAIFTCLPDINILESKRVRSWPPVLSGSLRFTVRRQAALADGMNCIAVNTNFPYQTAKDYGILDEQQIVPNPKDLMVTEEKFFVQVV